MISFRWNDGLEAWLCIAPVLNDWKCRISTSLHLFLFSPSCRSLTLSFSLSFFLLSSSSQPRQASRRIAVGVLHLPVCEGVPVRRLSEQVSWAGLISQMTPHTCILACHPISATPVRGACLREPIFFPLEHNNVQFYQLSFGIWGGGDKCCNNMANRTKSKTEKNSNSIYVRVCVTN